MTDHSVTYSLCFTNETHQFYLKGHIAHSFANLVCSIFFLSVIDYTEWFVG